MKLHRIALALFGLVAITMAGSACADNSLDLNLNDNAARLSYMTAVTPTGLYVNAAYLYNRHRGDVINAGIHLIGDAGVGPNPLRAGLGGQVYYFNPDISGGGPAFGDAGSGEAVAIGGFIRYQLASYNRIGFGGHIYYAPQIISFGGLDRMFEYGVRADYQVLRNANVYIGYRQVKADFGSSYYDLDTGLHVGMQLRF